MNLEQAKNQLVNLVLTLRHDGYQNDVDAIDVVLAAINTADRLQHALDFFGIELIPSGEDGEFDYQFKPSTMDKYRKSQNDTENARLRKALDVAMAELDACGHPLTLNAVEEILKGEI